ncbi:MAG: hypothetical protein MJZ66_00410 [Bacteroidales bacterium]|nr:hypothetical protein [Bacteroidales bacterium]
MNRKFIVRIFGIVVALFLILAGDVAHAQLRTRVFLSPRLKIGWTFYSGFNYGLEMNIGLFNLKEEKPEINVCLAPQYMLVNYKGNVHSLISVNAVLESDYYRLTLGMGEALTKWGFNNRNSNKAFGYNVGLGLSTSSKFTPWVEANGFVLKNGYWEFYGRPYYLSVSGFFRPDPYVVYETN